MEYYTSISKSSDEDNCVSFNCPHCNERFKLEVNEFEEFEGDKLYCPSCGLHGEISEFYSDDMMEAAEVEAMNMAKDLINNMFKGLSKKSSKNVRIKATPLKKDTSPTLYEKDDLELFKTDCCQRIIKINPISYSIKPYCPYCGGIS
ncbi:hypothetical protein [Ureibacillus manganicus]|uniref:DPH-type MB domain-containing protein n=1 Tax=Ureibacillus manganicus DSM 26584 TaxID=1384049 RepID=A0A0A3HSY9_9BACL|nr:hypothetical protein [Ureibacillus manganicus]KGR74300.1 hypothetical protein CD29_18920 [Ureibacillus manganicus DSM 26584]